MKSFSVIRAHAFDVLRRVGEAALSLLYPPHCANCGCETAADVHVCDACLGAPGGCRRRFARGARSRFRGRSRASLSAGVRRAALSFHLRGGGVSASGVVREFIHRFKYNQHFYLRHPARRLAGGNAGRPADAGAAARCLVPVPLHPARQRERDFNQAEVLARLLAERAGKPLLAALERTRYTTTQTQLDREERMENLRGAFRLRQHATVKGRHLLLIDDVFTTGSTVDECARVLQRGGAASVRVLTVARAVSLA